VIGSRRARDEPSALRTSVRRGKGEASNYRWICLAAKAFDDMLASDRPGGRNWTPPLFLLELAGDGWRTRFRREGLI
jgi:hypothetical protein